MYRVRISRSFGGEQPMYLLSTHIYSSKQIALAEALKALPPESELNWTKGKDDEEIKFNFRVSSFRIQIWIDKCAVDEPIENVLKDDAITEWPIRNEQRGFVFE